MLLVVVDARLGLRQLLQVLLELQSDGHILLEVDVRLRSVVLADHVVLVDDFVESSLYCVKLMLQPVHVFLLGLLKLPHDLLLGVDLAVEQLILGHHFVDLCLELGILLGQNVDLPRQSLRLYLGVLCRQHLISVFAFALHEEGACGLVLLLLLLVALNPHLSGLLLACQDLTEIANLLAELFLGELELPLDCLLLRIRLL